MSELYTSLESIRAKVPTGWGVVANTVVSAAESAFADYEPSEKATMVAAVVGRWLLDRAQHEDFAFEGQWDADHVRMVVSECVMDLGEAHREAIEGVLAEVEAGTRGG